MKKTIVAMGIITLLVVGLAIGGTHQFRTIAVRNVSEKEAFEITKDDANALTTFKDNVTSVAGGGTALDFDGNNDYVTMTTTTNLFPQNITISCWIKWADSGDALEGIVDGTSPSGANEGYLLAMEGVGNKVRFYVDEDGGGDWKFAEGNSALLSDGTWYHIVGVRDSTSIRLYVDGVLQTTTNTPTGITYDSDNNLFVGVYAGTPPGTTRFQGVIDEVAIWSKALGANDITDLYDSGTGLYPNPADDFPTDGGSMGDDMEGLWHFDEGSGSSAADSSPRSHTGTLTSMDANDWVAGKVTIPGLPKENTIFQSRDGIAAEEYGAVEVGANDVRLTINGKTIRFEIDGSEKIHIDASGYVGIGVTPSASILAIVGLPAYTNNASATSAGLSAGDLYRIGDNVGVVH